MVPDGLSRELRPSEPRGDTLGPGKGSNRREEKDLRSGFDMIWAG